jgi:hypothetical protein
MITEPISWIVVGIMLIIGGVFLRLFAERLLPSINFAYKRKNNEVAMNKDFSNETALSPNTLDTGINAIMKADSHLRTLLLADPSLTEKIQTTLDFYKPSRGRFTAWWQRGKAEGRVALQEVLNKEQILIIQQAATLENEVREGKKKEVEYNVFVARHVTELLELKARASLIEQAFGKGMTVDHYSEVNKESAYSNIRVGEYERKIEIDKQTEAWRIEQNLSAAERYKMTEDAVTNRLRKELEEALKDRDKLANDSSLSASAREELKDLRQSQIDNLKFRIKAREARMKRDEGA